MQLTLCEEGREAFEGDEAAGEHEKFELIKAPHLHERHVCFKHSMQGRVTSSPINRPRSGIHMCLMGLLVAASEAAQMHARA